MEFYRYIYIAKKYYLENKWLIFKLHIALVISYKKIFRESNKDIFLSYFNPKMIL